MQISKTFIYMYAMALSAGLNGQIPHPLRHAFTPWLVSFFIVLLLSESTKLVRMNAAAIMVFGHSLERMFFTVRALTSICSHQQTAIIRPCRKSTCLPARLHQIFPSHRFFNTVINYSHVEVIMRSAGYGVYRCTSSIWSESTEVMARLLCQRF